MRELIFLSDEVPEPLVEKVRSYLEILLDAHPFWKGARLKFVIDFAEVTYVPGIDSWYDNNAIVDLFQEVLHITRDSRAGSDLSDLRRVGFDADND